MLGLISLDKKKKAKITLFVNDYWRWILLPIAIPRWGLMFPNIIMQNYSKVAFIWQKQHKLWIINNYWAQIACLSLILAQCTTAGKSHVPEAKFIGIKGVRRGNMKKNLESRAVTSVQVPKSSIAYTLIWLKGCFSPLFSAESLILSRCSQGQSLN